MSEQENPFETPSPKGIRVVQATLRVIVAIQCWGYAASYLHHHNSYAFLEVIQQGYDIPAGQFAQMEKNVAYLLVGSGFITLFRPMWLLLIPLIVWQSGSAVSGLIADQSLPSILQPFIEAVRWVVPSALLLVDFWPPRVKPTLAFCLSAVGLVRLATATTFLAHGIGFLYQSQNGGEAVEVVTLCAQNLFERILLPNQVQLALAAAGIVEIVFAVSLISSRNRMVAFLMTLWGIMIAASETFAFTFNGYHRTLMQFAMAGAPFGVLLFWMKAYREQKPIILPEDELV
ncbi:hypothetical protein N9153_01660 [Planctomicrobium sp.]|jgi:hypothetical protein|nr:hypothetical protein [Planctomicrobium sp.]MDB4439610.1 hypothetical protein [Planctomicrobium sp.]